MIQIPFEQIQSLLKVADLFEPVKQSFIDYNSSNLLGVPVSLLHFPNNADVHIKTAAIKGYSYFSIKIATLFPENKAQNIAPYNGSVFLFDANTGAPTAILNDRGVLTDLRTAAAGAIITHLAAPKSANTVSVIGTGIQAYHQIDAFTKLRHITDLTIYGRNKNNALLLKNKLAQVQPTLAIKIAKTPEEAVKKAAIIISTTPSKLPLIKGKWLQNGQHITAVGADDTLKNEIDTDCFKLADTVFVDSLELNKKYGEYSHAIKSFPNLIDKTIEFGEAFSTKNFANNGNKITVAKLVGVGVQDLAAATLVMNRLKL